MRRREFIRLIGGVTVIVSHPAWPQQSGRMRRIGMLTGIPETNALAALSHRAL